MKRLVIGCLLVLAGCSSGGWTSAQEDQWREDCLNSPSACECMLDYFQDNGHTFEDVAGSDGFSIGFRAGVECGY